MYEYVDYVLSNYLNVSVGHSEEEALSVLRAHIKSNAELAEGVREDLQSALFDEDYSWKEAFARNDVISFEHEAQARAYARSLFLEQLFASL